MNDLKFQGMILLLIGCISIPIGWYAMFSDSMFAGIMGALVSAGSVGSLAFGYLFVKFSIVEGR